MTEQKQAFALNEWHLGSMNDGLFIIDTPPRPSTDEVHHGRTDGPTMVLNVTNLPYEKARAIVEAHNRALRLFAATPATAAPIVTVDMLDALISALDARAGYPHDHFATVYSESEKASARDWYRPALEAALKVKEAGR